MKAPDVQMELNPCENNRTSVVTSEEKNFWSCLCKYLYLNLITRLEVNICYFLNFLY